MPLAARLVLNLRNNSFISIAHVACELSVRSSIDINLPESGISKNSAHLLNLSERMKNLRLPLKPFPGCIGVAPALREAQSSITADTHGGNMDYNELVEGTTVYLPVHTAGAYLYIGDGHAAQGHGETSGGGIETSLQVRFRVTLQKQNTIPSVRAESSQHLMAMGMARPLDEAFQRATVNMIDWLTGEFNLSAAEAHVLLGSTADYDIANVRNPRYTVVCKVDKALLRQLVGNE